MKLNSPDKFELHSPLPPEIFENSMNSKIVFDTALTISNRDRTSIEETDEKDLSDNAIDTSIYNSENLDLVLSNTLPAEESLATAINDKYRHPEASKTFFWEKLGFSNTKK